MLVADIALNAALSNIATCTLAYLQFVLPVTTTVGRSFSDMSRPARRGGYGGTHNPPLKLMIFIGFDMCACVCVCIGQPLLFELAGTRKKCSDN